MAATKLKMMKGNGSRRSSAIYGPETVEIRRNRSHRGGSCRCHRMEIYWTSKRADCDRSAHPGDLFHDFHDSSGRQIEIGPKPRLWTESEVCTNSFHGGDRIGSVVQSITKDVRSSPVVRPRTPFPTHVNSQGAVNRWYSDRRTLCLNQVD